MKKVLFISPQQYGYMSDHYYLAKYAKEKYDLTFLCFDKGYEKQNSQSIKVEYMSFSIGKVKRSIYFIRKTLFLCEERKFDVVFCADSKLSLFLGMVIKVPLKILDIRTGGISHNKLNRSWSNIRTKWASFF